MALTQLVSRGRQDDDFTRELSPSYFGKVWVPRAPFALEQIEQVWDGTVGWNQRIACEISRNGDLVTSTLLEITMQKQGTGYYPAEQLIDRAELWLGKVLVQTLEGDYLRVHQELFSSSDQKSAYRRLTDWVDGEQDGVFKRFYLRLPWYFDSVPHLAIPLVAAQYHSITLVLHLAKSVAGTNPLSPPQVRLFVEYAFLATPERRKVALSEHQFVIEQVQAQSTPIKIEDRQKEHKVDLSFNFPCKWLAFNFGNTLQKAHYTAKQPGETAEAVGVLDTLTLVLNGTPRFQRRASTFFNSYMPYVALPGASQPRAGIYFYPFNMQPQERAEYSSDAVLNFSRLDSAVLHFSTKAANAATEAVITDPSVTLEAGQGLDVLRVYACTLNVLQVRQGMFGLKYAN